MVDFQSRNSRQTGTRSDDESTGSADDVTDADSSAAGERTGRDDGTPGRTAVGAAVVTVSDERTAEDDPGGDAVVEALESAEHEVRTREILRTSHDSVQHAVDTLVDRDDVDVVVTNGGTGIGPHDVTVDAIEPLVDSDLPGFGELFRRRYAEVVGTDAIATRATAGIAETTPVFCLPGDPEGARIGTREIVVEQAERLADVASRDVSADP